jgi:hypothetical protein
LEIERKGRFREKRTMTREIEARKGKGRERS